MNSSHVETADSAASERRTFRNPLDAPIALLARRFGTRAKEVERFLKFAVVGVTGAVVDFGILIVMQATLLPPGTPDDPNKINVALATGIAFLTAVISNFIWTRMWVYPDSRSRSLRRQLALFTFISVIGGVARTLWVTFASFRIGPVLMPAAVSLVHIFRPEYLSTPEGEAKLGSIVAQMIGMAVVMLWNFFANRYWTYNDVE
jgi:putative flippase GtrA